MKIYAIENEETGEFFGHEDEDNCATFYKEYPYLSSETDIKDTFDRITDLKNEYEVYATDSLPDGHKSLDACREETKEKLKTYLSQLRIVKIRFEVVTENNPKQEKESGEDA